MKKILGTKLKIARENIGITQDELAKAVNLSRKYISILEAGKRRPSLVTLIKFSDYLKKDLSYFLMEEEGAFAILHGYERMDRKTKRAINKFQKYCEEYLHLEAVTDHRPELAPVYTNISAERMAEEERGRLGLGNEPIKDIFSLIELGGCHVIRQPFPEESTVSGVFIYLETEGAAFSLVNCTPPLGQQVFIAAHEYCHFLKDRHSGPIIDNPDIFIDEYVSLYHPREQFAQTFANHFLMPPAKVEELIEKDIRLKQLRFEDVIYLKRYFGISSLAMMRTLRALGYLSSSKFGEYQKNDSDRFEETVFGNLSEGKRLPRRKRRVIHSARFKRLAIDAYKKKKITSEKLSELLNQDKNKILSTIREAK